MDREIFIFPVQLTSSRIGNLTRLIHTIAICVTIHTYYTVLYCTSYCAPSCCSCSLYCTVQVFNTSINSYIRRRRGQLDRGRARGVLNPFARESKARTGRFLRDKLMFDHSLFSSYEDQQGVASGQDSWGLFLGCAGLWTARCWLARQLHQLKASTTMDLGI